MRVGVSAFAHDQMGATLPVLNFSGPPPLGEDGEEPDGSEWLPTFVSDFVYKGPAPPSPPRPPPPPPPPPPPSPPPAPQLPAPPPMGDLAQISLVTWNCTLDATNTFCESQNIELSSVGPAPVNWAIWTEDPTLFMLSKSSGTLGAGDSETVVLDVRENRLDVGYQTFDFKFYTNEWPAYCHSPEEVALPSKTIDDVEYLCMHTLHTYAVDVKLTPGMVRFPSSQDLEVNLDGAASASTQVIFTDVINGAPYTVEIQSACSGALEVTGGGSGQLKRMIPQAVEITAQGNSSLLQYDGSSVLCEAAVLRGDDPNRNVTVTFNVTSWPGMPHPDTSVVLDHNLTQSDPNGYEIKVLVKDRLGRTCTKPWPGTRFTLEAVGTEGERIALPGWTISEADGQHHVLTVPTLDLDAGEYTLEATIGGDDGSSGKVATNGALTLNPVVCTGVGEAAAGGGRECQCKPGYRGDASDPAIRCSACDVGTYKEGDGNAGCTTCPGGATTANGGSASRLDCLCPKGFFARGEGDAFTCASCLNVLGEGSSTDGVGALSEDDCLCGPEYYRDADGMCVDCPEGARCSGGYPNSMVIEPNYWRASADSDRLHTCEAPRGVSLCQGTVAAERLREEAAADSISAANSSSAEPSVWGEDICLPGHTGPLCWECVESFGKRLGVCEACGSTSGAMSQSAVFVALGAALFVFALHFLVSQNLGRVMEDQERAVLMDRLRQEGLLDASAKQKPEGMDLTMGVIKILVTWLQMASLANRMRVPTGPEMAELMKWEDLGNVSPWSFSSFNCVARVGFFTKFYLSLFVPIACIPLAGVVVALVQAGRQAGGLLAGVRVMVLRGRRSAQEAPAVQAAADVGLWGAGVSTLDVFVMVMQMLVFLSYTMVNNMVMSVFKCRELDPGLDVLAMEVSVQCGTEAHRTAVYVGFAAVALITVGAPLQAFLLMRAVRERLDDAPNAVRYGFFFLNYRREVYWYECAALFRKAALVATVVLFEDRLGVQVFSVSLVSTVFLTVHTYSKPYTLTALNNLETFALFVSTVTLSSTSFFYGTRYTGSIDRTYELGLSWAIILMSVGLLAASASPRT